MCKFIRFFRHRRISLWLALSALFITLSLAACNQVVTPQIITADGDVIDIELAVTTEEKSRGLMNRTELDADAGMLFVFDSLRTMSFWMKNTLIPLDVVFIDEDRTVVDVQTMVPCLPEETSCPSYRSKAKAIFALEINGGRALELGIRPGDKLEFKLPSYVENL